MKIGVTGIANCGKTVFLTSLLWQLTELESANFTVSKKIGVHGFKPLNRGSAPEGIFPFEGYREKLSSGGKWPAKTKDCYRYACEIRRKDWSKIDHRRLARMRRLQFSGRQKLDFFDFPGERIADAAIAAYEEYNEWCDHILHHFKSHSDYFIAVSPYLNFLGNLDQCKDVAVAEKVIHAYKLALAGLIHGYKPLISPSTFLLDCSGTAAAMLPDAQLAATRITGLTAESQFAPLTHQTREMFPNLAKQMARNYSLYRKKLAWPMFKEIIESQRLVILIDIPSLLIGGVGRYNDNRQIVLDLFEAIEPNGVFGALFQKLQIFFGLGLEKVAFVAVKSDLVHPDDIINGRLELLLRQMTAKAKNTLPDVEFGYFVCSAIHSTRAGIAAHHLIARPANSNPEHVEVEFDVSPLPETWPVDWKVGELRFIEVLPESPACLMIPPKQVGLDRLFEFLLAGDVNAQAKTW